MRCKGSWRVREGVARAGAQLAFEAWARAMVPRRSAPSRTAGLTELSPQAHPVMPVKRGWQGRFCEDFEPRDVYRSRFGRTITEADDLPFTSPTLDTNPLHFDQRRPKRRAGAHPGELMIKALSVTTACLLVTGTLAGAQEDPPPKKADGFSTELRLSIDPTRTDVGKISREQERRMEEVLRLRLPIFTTTGAGTASVQGPTDIKVRFPAENPTPLQLNALVRLGRFEIRHLDDLRTSENPRGRYDLNVLTITDQGKPRSDLRFFDHRSGRPVPMKEFIERCPVVAGGEDVEVANVVTSGALMAVRVQFTQAGTVKLQRFTKKPGRVLGVVLDNEVISISAVVGKATKKPKGEKGKTEKTVPDEEVSQVDVLGGFQTVEEANYLATVLTAGPLPAPLKVVGSRLVPD
jgi:hypothetical protein